MARRGVGAFVGVSVLVLAVGFLVLAVAPPASSQGPLRVESMYVGFGTNPGAASERYRFDIRGALGTPWQRLPKVDGLRLQGTYVSVTRTVDPTWIAFAPEGGFRDQGVVKYAGNLPFLERGLQAPPGGSASFLRPTQDGPNRFSSIPMSSNCSSDLRPDGGDPRGLPRA